MTFVFDFAKLNLDTFQNFLNKPLFSKGPTQKVNPKSDGNNF